MDDSSVNGSPALVLAAGDAPEPIPPLDGAAYVVAADGGLVHAARLGVTPDVVVGDLDSASPADVEEAIAAGARVERHSADKDATDWELALHHVRNAGFRRVVIVGGGGGRVDHFLSNALVLTSPELATLEVVWHLGTATVRVARPELSVSIPGTAGDPVTLLAVGGDATGIATSGLRWRLDGATLPPATSRGVSNELVDPPATVSIGSGALLVIHERTRS